MDLLADVGEAKELHAPRLRARDVFLPWERRLRPVYNLVLASETLAIWGGFWWVGSGRPRLLELIPQLIVCCVAANVLFTAGPLVDLYVSTVVGRRSNVRTGLFFSAGLLISIPIAALVAAMIWLPSFD